MLSSFWRVTFNFSISSRAGLLRGWSGRSSSSSWQPWTRHLWEGVPQLLVSWSPSSSIISTSCWEDLLKYSSWDTPLVNIGGISFLLLKTTVYNQPSSLWTELKKQNFTKFYFSSFIYLNSGVFFFLNCVCFEGSAAGLPSSPLTCKSVCSRLTWAEWRKKIN